MMPLHTAVPIWIDLTVTDVDRAKRFYGELFGWTFEDRGADFGHYNIVRLDGLELGGAAARGPQDDGSPDAFAVYLSTDSAQATAERSIEAGATVVVPPMAIGERGTMLSIIDPSGAYIGAWQPGTRRGFQTTTGSLGAPGWIELMTNDYDAAVPFYRDVFGFTGVEMEGMRYATNAPERDASYGIGDASSFLPSGTPSYWRVYFGVADTDAATERIRNLGGAVLDGPIDSPFGPLATVADDQGVSFQVLAQS